VSTVNSWFPLILSVFLLGRRKTERVGEKNRKFLAEAKGGYSI
jgi:hypothetical protein